MKAIIVAGGRGERLRPITDVIPKPMVEVSNKPILLHIIELLKKYNISEFILALCYFPESIISYFGDGSKFGVNIKYTFEDMKTPLGTAGAISLARKMINDTFIVTYGDILRKLNVGEMIASHKRLHAFATLNVYRRESKGAKSEVLIDKKRRIVKFIERPKLHKLTRKKIWTNGSFYIFQPEIFNWIADGQKSDFGKDIFPKLLSSKKAFYAYPTTGYFIDIGNLKKLELAKRTFKKLIFLSK